MKNPKAGILAVYPSSGGLETVSIPGTQTPGRLANGTNFMIDINGAKRKHPGTARRQDNGSSIITSGNTQGLFDYWRTSGSDKVRRTVVVTDGKVYADNGDGLYLDVTGANSIASSDSVSLETFFGLLILSFENNPGNNPLKFDGSTLAALGGTPPNFTFSRTWQNRLWGSGNPAAPDRLYASSIDNPEDWNILNTAQVINIDQGDQDPVGITSLFPPNYGRMIVGKRRSLYEVTPVSTTFAINSLINGIGSISHNAVAAVDNDILFVSERGIHSLMMTDKFGQLETAFLSYPIQDYFQDNIDFQRASNMKSIYVPELNCYLLAATQKGSIRNDVVLGYNLILKEWFKFDENVSAFAKYVDPQDGNKTKILIADDAGRLGILDTNKTSRKATWFDEDRTTQFTTGIVYPINAATEVAFSKITCYFRPQTENSYFDLTYYIDGRQVDTLNFPMDPASGSIIGEAAIGTGLIGGRGRIKQVSRELKGTGHSIEILWSHTPTTTDEDFELFGYIVEYEYAGESSVVKTQ